MHPRESRLDPRNFHIEQANACYYACTQKASLPRRIGGLQHSGMLNIGARIKSKLSVPHVVPFWQPTIKELADVDTGNGDGEGMNGRVSFNDFCTDSTQSICLKGLVLSSHYIVVQKESHFLGSCQSILDDLLFEQRGYTLESCLAPILLHAEHYSLLVVVSK
jgi:hypothetical protein